MKEWASISSRHGRRSTPSDTGLENSEERVTYTRLLIYSETGMWLCPNCEISPKVKEGQLGNMPDWGWQSGLAVKNTWTEWEKATYYPEKYKDLENRFWFANPACVTECQNNRSDGLDGPPCGFNRLEYDKSRDLGKEKYWDAYVTKEEDKENPQGSFCLSCVRKNPESYEDPELAKMLKEDIHKKRRVVFEPEMNRFTATVENHNYRFNMYDGTKKSLKCGTTKYGKGDHPDSANEGCCGAYGRSGIYWKRIKDRISGEYKWIEVDYVPPNRKSITKKKALDEVSMEWGKEELEEHLAGSVSSGEQSSKS